MWIRITRYICGVTLLFIAAVAVQPTWAQLPTPSQPILLVQDSGSADPYQNFAPELLTTEGLNGFQIAQLSSLTASFLTHYDVVILPHLSLTSAEATLFQNYVNAGGTLVGFRPDLQLANVFGVASLGTTLQEAWLKIDTTTPYASSLVNNALRFHGTADLYSLNGASALATLYYNTTSPTTSPAAAVNSYGLGHAILFSFDLTQSIVLMRQGNPAWAGYPNTHDGYNTMRAGGMFMDQGSGQFWNDRGDGALNDIPQADIQLRLFSNAVTLTNAAKRPLPRLWYFPNQNRAQLLMTGDDHSYPVADALGEINSVSSFGGLFSYNLWYPFTTASNSQVSTWLSSGDSMGIHFNDTAEVDSSGVGGSAASWNGMQGVMSKALTSFASTYPDATYPVTTRDHFLIWVSNDADGTADQVAQAKLFQNNGIQLDTTYSSFPNRWGYMTGSGLPMKFLDTVAGNVIPVYEQATQFEDDIQVIPGASYSLNWDQVTAQSHYVQSLSDSLNKYNTVVTALFHPEFWSPYDQTNAQALLQYAQAQSIPMSTTTAWLRFWQARATTTLSMPSFAANTLTFTATGAPAGLTLLVPQASGSSAVVSGFQVDGVSQSFAVEEYQGVMYASVVLTAGNHNIAVTYGTAGRILGQVSPSTASSSTTIQVQGGSITQTVAVASDGTYMAGPLPAGTYTVAAVSLSNTFSPTSQPVTLGTADVTNVNFAAISEFSGETLLTTQTPAVTNSSDGAGVNYELGTAFTSDVTGTITGIRFWKASNEVGTHTGNIWSSAGALLASVTFTNETASGWQQQALTTPIAIAANTHYVVSVNTGDSYYVYAPGGLSSQVTNQDLSSVAGDDGVYSTVPGTFPTTANPNGANYFRDVFFVPNVASSLASLTLNPASVTGGSSTTGTVTLNVPAPLGGAAVALSATNPLALPHAIQTVNLSGAMQAGGTISWSSVGAPSTSLPSGTAVPVSGISGLTATFSGAGLPLEILTECPADNCGWNGNFAPGASILWTNGQYIEGGTWVGNGPLTVTFSSPQRGIGFPIMADDNGVFSGTICAYDSTNTELGCVPFTGNGSNAQASFIGIYDDTQEIASVTIDASGALYQHDFAIGDVLIVNAEEQLATVPSTVTIPTGEYATTFQVTTNEVSTSTPLTITGNYNGTQFATLTLTPPVLSSVIMSPVSVPGGSSSTGIVTLNTPAPSGGAIIALTSNVPVVQPNTIQAVNAPSALPADGSVAWLNQGPSFTSLPSGTVVPVSGLPGVNMTVSNSANTPLDILSECPADNCGWNGNFTPGAGILWVTGTFQSDGSWVGYGPISVTFNTPQRGLGFQIMADATGQFTATLCAYNSSNTQLGCASFTGTESEHAQPIFVGVYDDTQEISMITIDASGSIHPHDFAIGDMTVASTQRVVAAVVPTSVTVPAGATTANFTVTTNQVNASTPVTITATYDGTNASATLMVTTPGISAVSVAPATVSGGSPSTGTVTLNGPAPTGGAVVTLTSGNAAATVPPAVTVPAGSTSITFTVTTSTVITSTPVTITGKYNGVEQMATLTIDAASSVATVAMNQASVTGGSPSTGTVTLNGPAPAGGASVALVSSDPSTTVPASVTVLAGTNTATFTATTIPVSTQMVVTITATYNSVQQTTKLTVNPPSITSVALNPTTIVSEPSGTPSSSIATVTLNATAPTGGVTVNVASSNTAAATLSGSSVTVPAGTTSTTFPVSSVDGLSATATSSISASLAGGGTQSATLTVILPASGVVSLGGFSANPVQGGLTSPTVTVTLNGPAPTGGAVVAVASNSAAASVPGGGTVTVPANATSTTFTVTTSTVGAQTVATISATYNSVQQTANLTVNPPSIVSVGLNPTTIISEPSGTATTSTATVTLNATAPTGGVTVNVASSNTAAATLSGSLVTVPAGSTSTTFAVSSVNGLTATATSNISATLTGGGSQAATLTVIPPASGVTSLGLSTNTVQGGSTNPTATITLNGPAPTGGAVVTVASSNTSAATVPSGGTVTVPANTTSTTFPVTTLKIGAQAVVTISATYKGVQQTATLTVNPPSVTSLTLNPTSITSQASGTATTSTATVTLNAAAPTGGVAVNVASSNTAAATLSVSSVTVPAGSVSKTFVVTSVDALASTATSSISATLTGGGTQSATLTVVPAATGVASVGFSANPVQGGSTNPTGTVTLNGPAPTGGAIVTLASNSAAAGVPGSVTVAANAKTATFTVTTVKVSAQTIATISATYNSVLQTANLTVNPPTITSVTLSPTSVIGGATSTATVKLNATAPTGGVVVNVASSNTAVATLSVTTVTVLSGSTTATFTVTSIPVAATSTSSISANWTGGSTQSATLTVTPPTLSSLTLNPATVTHPASSTGTVTISGAAPAGGFVVNLSSSNTGVGTVPATMTIAAGATSGTFTVTTLAAAPPPGRITISASKTGSTTRTANLSVN